MNTVLVLGLGEIGAWALEFLARSDGVDHLIAARRDAEQGALRASMAAVGATFQHAVKPIDFVPIDVFEVDTTARTLETIRPDAILTSVTIQSPRTLAAVDLAPEVRDRLREAAFSMWLPWHLSPVIKLMAAVHKSGIATSVVNVAFPDVVNPILWRHAGVGPLLGAGNIEMIAATLQRYVCERYAVAPERARVSVVASHAFLSRSARIDLPSFISIAIDGDDITQDVPIDDVIGSPVGVAWSRTSNFSAFAASASRNVVALLDHEQHHFTATAPNGLPGGYPVKVSRGVVELDLPAGISLERALTINEAGNKYDGIAGIDAEGTVTYTQAAIDAMRCVGYDRTQVRVDQVDLQVAELNALFRRLLDRHALGTSATAGA